MAHTRKDRFEIDAVKKALRQDLKREAKKNRKSVKIELKSYLS